FQQSRRFYLRRMKQTLSQIPVTKMEQIINAVCQQDVTLAKRIYQDLRKNNVPLTATMENILLKSCVEMIPTLTLRQQHHKVLDLVTEINTFTVQSDPRIFE